MTVGFEEPARPQGSSSAPLSVGLRSGVLNHRSPLVRMAPWLLLVAVVFALTFLPLMVIPEFQRWTVLREERATALQAARDAQSVAKSLAQLAGEVPQLQTQVQEKERGLITVEELPSVVTCLAQQAEATGASLTSMVFGPYQPVEAAAASGGTGNASASGEDPAVGRGTGGDSGQATQNPGPSTDTRYGRVTVEVTATGTWSQLAQFAGAVVRDSGLRVHAWSISAKTQGGPYQMSLRADLFLKGQPPVSQGAPVTVEELGQASSLSSRGNAGNAEGGASR
ncbi:hypothetical protein Tmar_0672 [Thermaerobacter marianensis DSM 12885]|uniref:Uncharacterized protein n=1 Tax=Thermaerobacter marianensis (strain ATCC 700841 / DSM 12885 / JCM 10246 / 7p75a) TaxID=644966 RepID=E6SHU2_THEM7|nr:hypothetical protein [Thermaerobacter marianensis]ADU50789.1 hypothetical protein Tmar_0672 [Thermaerobacter marianensis DSM 12885]